MSLQIRGMNVDLAGHAVLRGVDVSLEAGQTVAFGIEAKDRGASVATTLFPPGVRDRECLVRFGEGTESGAFGAYLAAGLAYDINGWMTTERLLRRLGTRQRYTPVTVDNAPVLRAAELVTGTCTGFTGGRTLTVNGKVMPCNNANWPVPLPTQRNHGYCIQTTAGQSITARFTMR